MSHSLIDEIYAAVLREMELRGIEDTPETRRTFLIGLRNGWMEDEDRSMEKALYLLAVNNEISRLKIEIPDIPE